jgi:hypothetical protein
MVTNLGIDEISFYFVREILEHDRNHHFLVFGIDDSLFRDLTDSCISSLLFCLCPFCFGSSVRIL